MGNLRSIVYVSTANELMSSASLELLLVEARRLNEANGITGVLLYDAGTFMQCIEGEDAGMTAAYERIRQSRQHRGIIELRNDVIQQRSFEGWQLGFARPTSSALLALSTAVWASGEGQGDAEFSDGLFLLKDFWRRSQLFGA